MIKSTTRIWFYIFFIFTFSFGTYVVINWKYLDSDTLFSSIFFGLFYALLFIGLPIWLATKCKTIILDEKGIKIVFPFLQRQLYYLFTDIAYFESYTGDARGIEFKVMKITVKNKKAIIITSGANTKFEEMNIFLQQRIEKK